MPAAAMHFTICSKELLYGQKLFAKGIKWARLTNGHPQKAPSSIPRQDWGSFCVGV
jgi:hypothetical protein